MATLSVKSSRPRPPSIVAAATRKVLMRGVVLSLVSVLAAASLSGSAEDNRIVADETAAVVRPASAVKPSAPRLVRHERTARSGVVRWSAPARRGSAPIVKYRVVRHSTGKPSARVWRSTVSARSRSLRMTSLSPGVSYSVAVRAVSAAGVGPASRTVLRPVSRQVLSPAIVAAPSRPAIVSSAAGDGTMSASWAPGSAIGQPITGWRVSRDGVDSEGKGPWSTVVPAAQRAFEMTLLRNGTTYAFSVAAVSAGGNGPAATVRLTPRAPSPAAPTVTSSAAGNGTMSASWSPGSATGPAITGWRVSRDGVDSEGKGPWSTVVPVAQRAFEMTLLRNGTTYSFSVAAVSARGDGPATTVRLTPRAPAAPVPTPTPPVASNRPVVVQSAVGQPSTLRRGSASGERLRMAGVAVWGVPDSITDGGGFGLSQYADRAKIVAAAKSWGANHIRLRVLADDYNNNRQGLSKAARLSMIKGWRDAANAQGLYLYVTWWDSLDGYAEDTNWPTRYASAFAMMSDVYAALGPDPEVFYEPFNEPNSFGDKWNAWSTAMRATVTHWRSIGYRGILIIDTPDWSHAYDDARMRALEAHDAQAPGMGGKHQLVFAKHDYANEGWADGGNTFEPRKWRDETGGTQRHHLIWETEYGNYNGSPSSVHLSWSQQASSFFADEFSNPARTNYVGATSFVWGPWWDANGLTDASNSTPTAWGRAVRDNFLGRAGAQRF